MLVLVLVLVLVLCVSVSVIPLSPSSQCGEGGLCVGVAVYALSDYARLCVVFLSIRAYGITHTGCPAPFMNILNIESPI